MGVGSRWAVAVIASLVCFGGCWAGLAAGRVLDTGSQVGIASVPLVVVLTVLGAWAERAREKEPETRVQGELGQTSEVTFQHIGTINRRSPQWSEYDHGAADCWFGADISVRRSAFKKNRMPDKLKHPARCDSYITLRDLVYGADLFLDVALINRSVAPVLLSRIGLEIIEAMNIRNVYGFKEPAKLSPAKDEYALVMPDLRDRVPEDDDPMVDPVAVRLNEQVWTRLPDPIYLPAGSPYRYLLRGKHYQRNVPNHARIQLLAEAGGELVRSPVLHVFTN